MSGGRIATRILLHIRLVKLELLWVNKLMLPLSRAFANDMAAATLQIKKLTERVVSSSRFRRAPGVGVRLSTGGENMRRDKM